MSGQVLLRRGDGDRPALKEKFVAIYEALFRGDQVWGADPDSFWDGLFLLKVNEAFLIRAFALTGEDQLGSLKAPLNQICIHCVIAIRDRDRIRVGHALQTLSIIFQCLFKKRFTNFGLEVMHLVFGIDSADAVVGDMITACCKILMGDDNPVWLKRLALRLFVVIATATENINQNSLLQYFMMYDSAFHAIMHVFVDPVARAHLVIDAALLLTVLVNFRKYELSNPYGAKLAALGDVAMLQGLMAAIFLMSKNNNASVIQALTPASGLFSRLSSWWSKKPATATEELDVDVNPAFTGVILLALYEAVHLNPAAISCLAVPPPGSPRHTAGSTGQHGAMLFGHFITQASFLVTDVKDSRSRLYARLALLILLCLMEIPSAAAFLCDESVQTETQLFKREGGSASMTPTAKMPLAGAIVSVLVACFEHNRRAQLPHELWGTALDVLHRMLCFLKRNRVRLEINWQPLWITLMKFLGFVASEHLVGHSNIIKLASKTVQIFNIFVTYGDMFLATPQQYDELYFELIRNRANFEKLFLLVEGHEIANDMTNIRLIIAHFARKLETPELIHSASQVLQLIRANYDTLTLKLPENLDQFDV
eukprot:TRINITY_DN1337_c0_g2_i1.p1 TRINITY_DN1337_c0_g2~~TRINITY_DN1337_c0_g2_i1.p1  ORF type:complete len:596 (+),score=101.08 TRINITY_DN1337_c0_g2_i1:178-1965(+)